MQRELTRQMWAMKLREKEIISLIFLSLFIQVWSGVEASSWHFHVGKLDAAWFPRLTCVCWFSRTWLLPGGWQSSQLCGVLRQRLLALFCIWTTRFLPVVYVPFHLFLVCVCVGGAGIACQLERRSRDRKVASSNPGRSSRRIFFSRVNFVCWLLFGVRSTPVLPQWHVKDPGHSAKVQVAGYT